MFLDTFIKTMTERELLDLIDKNNQKESEILEFKDWKNWIPTGKDWSNKRSVYWYCVAIGNEWWWKLIIGINDRWEIVWTNAELPDDIKQRIYEKTKQKIIIQTISTSKWKVIVINIPSHQPNRILKFNGVALMRVDDSLTEMDEEVMREILNENIVKDWSISICEGATLDDLLPEAIQKARELYLVKHHTKKDDIDEWDNATFLNKAKITIKWKITKTAILLLWKPESEHFLSPATSQISRILKNRDWIEIDYEHFSCPLILSVSKIHKKIRNLKYRYIKNETLFPEEVDTYDPYIIRESLNNCIVHQDYALGGKILVIENEDNLVFSNKGSFIPKTIERVINSDAPTQYYRNKFLADAMVNLNMIDTIWSWIKKMFILQKDKFFPLPEYDLSDNKVQLTIIGKVLDMDYARKLAQFKDLSLKDIILLDKIQKYKTLNEEEIRYLKDKHLIEWRKPHYHISLSVAQETNEVNEYLDAKWPELQHQRERVFEYIKTQKNGATKQEILHFMSNKMESSLQEKGKYNRIWNILQELQRRRKVKVDQKGAHAKRFIT